MVETDAGKKRPDLTGTGDGPRKKPKPEGVDPGGHKPKRNEKG